MTSTLIDFKNYIIRIYTNIIIRNYGECFQRSCADKKQDWRINRRVKYILHSTTRYVGYNNINNINIKTTTEFIGHHR